MALRTKVVDLERRARRLADYADEIVGELDAIYADENHEQLPTTQSL